MPLGRIRYRGLAQRSQQSGMGTPPGGGGGGGGAQQSFIRGGFAQSSNPLPFLLIPFLTDFLIPSIDKYPFHMPSYDRSQGRWAPG